MNKLIRNISYVFLAAIACHFSASAADSNPTLDAKNWALDIDVKLRGDREKLALEYSPEGSPTILKFLAEGQSKIEKLASALGLLEQEEKDGYRKVMNALNTAAKLHDFAQINTIISQEARFSPQVSDARTELRRAIVKGLILAKEVKKIGMDEKLNYFIALFESWSLASNYMRNCNGCLTHSTFLFNSLADASKKRDYVWQWENVEELFSKLVTDPQSGLKSLQFKKHNDPNVKIGELNVYDIAIARTEFLFVKTFHLSWARSGDEEVPIMSSLDFSSFIYYVAIGAIATNNQDILTITAENLPANQKINDYLVAYLCWPSDYEGFGNFSDGTYFIGLKHADRRDEEKGPGRNKINALRKEIKDYAIESGDIEVKYSLGLITIEEIKDHRTKMAAEAAKAELLEKTIIDPVIPSPITTVPQIPSTDNDGVPPPPSRRPPAPLPGNMLPQQPVSAALPDWKEIYLRPSSSATPSRHFLIMAKLVELRDGKDGYVAASKEDEGSVAFRKVQRINDIERNLNDLLTKNAGPCASKQFGDNYIEFNKLFDKENPENGILSHGQTLGFAFKYFANADSYRWLLDLDSEGKIKEIRNTSWF